MFQTAPTILIAIASLTLNLRAQVPTEWETVNFPDHSIFNGINDQTCGASDRARLNCLRQLSILARSASDELEFLSLRPRPSAEYEVVMDHGAPVLPSQDLVLLRHTERGLAELRALESSDPVEVRRRLDHEGALLNAVRTAGLPLNINYRDVRDRILARSTLPPRQVAANHVVHLFATTDPYLRLYQPIVDAATSPVNLDLRRAGDRLVLAHVKPLTNLDRAGLGVGDLVQTVNGMNLTTANLAEVTHAVDGNRPLLLNIKTVEGRELDVTIDPFERDWQVVRSYILNVNQRRIGVITIDLFADSRVCTQAEALLKSLGDQRVDAVIYDLRGNPGGYVDQMMCFLGLNLGPGRHVFTERVLRDTLAYESQIKGQVPDVSHLVTDRARVLPPVPVVTIIDHQTASAGELTTAALQENELSWVVGDRSYGKGVGQDVLRLLPAYDVLSWKTVARYDQLNGSSVQGRGVAPEFEVPSTFGARADDYEPPRFAEENGEAFVTPGVSVRRGPARRAAHRRIRACVPRTELHVDARGARWLRDQQLAGAVAVALCAPPVPRTAVGLR